MYREVLAKAAAGPGAIDHAVGHACSPGQVVLQLKAPGAYKTILHPNAVRLIIAHIEPRAGEARSFGVLVRANAAQSIGDAKAPALTTQSGELNLLSGPAPIAPASAEKPYFYRARVAAAAQSNDPAMKIRLLQGAAGIAPRADDVKLQLFDAAYRAKRYQTAVSAIYPLISRNGANIQEQEPQRPGDQPAESPNEDRFLAEQFLRVTGQAALTGLTLGIAAAVLMLLKPALLVARKREAS